MIIAPKKAYKFDIGQCEHCLQVARVDIFTTASVRVGFFAFAGPESYNFFLEVVNAILMPKLVVRILNIQLLRCAGSSLECVSRLIASN